MLAALGALPGLALGAALPFLIAWGFGAVLPLPLAPALHPGELALALLYGLLTAAAFALWPLGRAHDVPVSRAVPRRGRAAISAGRAGPTSWRPCWSAARWRSLAVELAYDQRIAAIFVAAAAAVFVLLRLVAALLMVAARRAAAPALAGRPAGHRQHPPAGRADAERRAVARPGPRAARHRDRDRRQPAPAVHGGAARPGAVVLFRRHPVRRGRAASTPSSARARRGATLDRVPMLRGRIVAANGVPAERLKPSPDAAWALQSDRGITYARRRPGRLARGRGPMVGAGLPGPAAGLVREAHRRRTRPQARRPGHRQRARPQHHRDHRQSAHASTGRASASISSWCSRPTPSAARLIPTSPP